jgi:hypothetical protein
MLFAHTYLLAALAFAGSVTGSSTGSEPVPHSNHRADFAAAGETLESVFRRLGEAYAVRLSAAPDLRSQRLTIYARDETLETLARGIRDLLTDAPDAGVFWRRMPSGEWRLAESLNRRRLRETLTNYDLDRHEQFLAELASWATGPGEQELQRSREASPEAERSSSVGRLHERVTLGLISEAMGPDGRQRVLLGGWWGARIGDLAQPLRTYLVEELRAKFSGPGAGIDDACWVVISRARHPDHPLGTRLIRSIVQPNGRSGARGTMLRIQHGNPASGQHIRVPPEVEDGDDPRVTLNLTPVELTRTRLATPRTLDPLLERLAEAAEITVIADGYRRQEHLVPDNLRLKDYPLAALLDFLTGAWSADWRYFPAEEPGRTVLVRARAWWMEDAADIPDDVFARMQTAFSGERPIQLEEVLEFADLTDAQAVRLIMSGVTGGAAGLILPLFTEEGCGKRAFQFFRRLPPPLQQQALTERGLPLDRTPPQLVEQWLGVALAVRGGVTPELRKGLTLTIRPQPGMRGWEAEILRSGEDRPLLRAVVLGSSAGLLRPTQLSAE